MNRSVWVGVVAAVGAIAYWLKFAKVSTATIRVFETKDGCRSQTDPYTLPVPRGKDVEWVLEDPDGCLRNASVEVRFKSNHTPPRPSPTHPDRPKGKGRIRARIKPQAPRGKHAYSVWYVGDDGTEYEMEDPEIQIN